MKQDLVVVVTLPIRFFYHASCCAQKKLSRFYRRKVSDISPATASYYLGNRVDMTISSSNNLIFDCRK